MPLHPVHTLPDARWKPWAQAAYQPPARCCRVLTPPLGPLVMGNPMEKLCAWASQLSFSGLKHLLEVAKRCFTSLKLLVEFSVLASTLWGPSMTVVFCPSCDGCPWYGIAVSRSQGSSLMFAFSDGDSESCSFWGCCGTLEPAFPISQSKNVHGRVQSIFLFKLKYISAPLGWWVWMWQSCRRGDTQFKCSSNKSWSGFYYTFLQSSEQIKW